jgi:hypothetical protein
LAIESLNQRTRKLTIGMEVSSESRSPYALVHSAESFSMGSTPPRTGHVGNWARSSGDSARLFGAPLSSSKQLGLGRRAVVAVSRL